MVWFVSLIYPPNNIKPTSSVYLDSQSITDSWNRSHPDSENLLHFITSGWPSQRNYLVNKMNQSQTQVFKIHSHTLWALILTRTTNWAKKSYRVNRLYDIVHIIKQSVTNTKLILDMSTYSPQLLVLILCLFAEQFVYEKLEPQAVSPWIVDPWLKCSKAPSLSEVCKIMVDY